MRIIALSLLLVSCSAFSQSAQVLECAGYVQKIDEAIMDADNQLHDLQVGVKKDNTIPFEEVANIRQEIWQATITERFDIRHITHLGNVPNCATIAESAINKVRAILDSHLTNAQISR
jgi:hypothetical protein